jgi:uncharacterized integral membrane protein
MYLRTLLIVIALALLALFTAANWSAFTTPTTLSLVFASVEAPLGLMLLGMLVLLTALFLIYVVYLQSSVLLDSRRHSRELQSQRELAERAEISRIQELRSFVESQLQTLATHSEQSKAELSAHLDRAGRGTAPVHRAMPELPIGVDGGNRRPARTRSQGYPTGSAFSREIRTTAICLRVTRVLTCWLLLMSFRSFSFELPSNLPLLCINWPNCIAAC